MTGAAAAALPGKNVSSLAATATDAAAAAADAATAADALQLPMEPDMVLRNAFRSAASSVVLTQPCAELSAEASAWCEALGLSTDTLRQWGAGMTRVQHPLQQREVWCRRMHCAAQAQAQASKKKSTAAMVDAGHPFL